MSEVLNFIRFEETKRERAFKEEEEEKGESQDVEKCTKREREKESRRTGMIDFLNSWIVRIQFFHSIQSNLTNS